jgi:hypothetical protein
VVQSVEETRAQLEAGWPEALRVAPEDLGALRAYDRRFRLKMWATILAIPLCFGGFAFCVAQVVRQALTPNRAFEQRTVRSPPPAGPAMAIPISVSDPFSFSSRAHNPRAVGLPKLFKVDRDLQLQLRPRGP